MIVTHIRYITVSPTILLILPCSSCYLRLACDTRSFWAHLMLFITECTVYSEYRQLFHNEMKSTDEHKACELQPENVIQISLNYKVSKHRQFLPLTQPQALENCRSGSNLYASTSHSSAKQSHGSTCPSLAASLFLVCLYCWKAIRAKPTPTGRGVHRRERRYCLKLDWAMMFVSKKTARDREEYYFPFDFVSQMNLDESKSLRCNRRCSD